MSIYESPIYKVLLKEGKYEVRQYEAFNTSSVVESNLKGNSGFGVLFSYISGNNKDSQKMSMTVPVINTFEDEDMTMEFVVPSMFKENVPTPNNEQMKIKHYPEQFRASLTFSGNANKASVDKHKEMLIRWVKKKNFNVIGQYRLARYNTPFSLPFLRRNEVMIDIEYQTE